MISTSGSFVQDKAEEAAKCIAELDVDRDGQVTNHSSPSGHVTQCSPPIGQVRVRGGRGEPQHGGEHLHRGLVPRHRPQHGVRSPAERQQARA